MYWVKSNFFLFFLNYLYIFSFLVVGGMVLVGVGGRTGNKLPYYEQEAGAVFLRISSISPKKPHYKCQFKKK